MSIIPDDKPLFAGRVLTGLSCLALAMDGVFKLATPDLMIANTPPLGLPADPALYRLLGAILLASVALHLWRRTALIGAILVTAFLGGAIAVNVRAGMPLFSNTLFGVYVGLFFWAGYWLRDSRIRAAMS